MSWTQLSTRTKRQWMNAALCAVLLFSFTSGAQAHSEVSTTGGDHDGNTSFQNAPSYFFDVYSGWIQKIENQTIDSAGDADYFILKAWPYRASQTWEFTLVHDSSLPVELEVYEYVNGSYNLIATTTSAVTLYLSIDYLSTYYLKVKHTGASVPGNNVYSIDAPSITGW